MPNDVITLNAVTNELKKLVCGGRIEKIYQPETDEITLSIKLMRKLCTLVVSANPSHPRIHITTQKKENSLTAPAFCMLLRKYLVGAFIENVEIFNSDRIIKITILAKNELKDCNRFFLMVELMGRYSNIILTTENMKIVDAIRRIHFDQSTTRYILPNLDYVIQPVTRTPLTDVNTLALLFANSTEITPEFLLKNISGIGKESATEIANSAKPFDTLLNMINIYDKDTYKPSLRYENGLLRDYYIYPYANLKGEYKEYNSLNEALDNFYLLYDGTERKKASTKTVSTLLKRLESKTERRIADNKEKLVEGEKAELYKKYGELILANIYKIQPRDNSLVCYDYYENKEVEISLDPLISASDNAQKYYKKYAKMKRASEIAQEQLSSLYEQKEYLNSIQVAINNCSLKSEYDEILAELNSLSGLRNVKKRSQDRGKNAKPTHIKVEGYDVYFGKNNLQNSEVTFSIGDGGDTWLHVKNHHGSHLIIKGKPTESVLYKCACIVAYFSSANSSSKVEVDYTMRKFVKKIPSAMPGMVTYTNYRSILAIPKDYTEIQDK